MNLWQLKYMTHFCVIFCATITQITVLKFQKDDQIEPRLLWRKKSLDNNAETLVP